MATINIYLNFDGNCEEAFIFYKTVFGGEFSHLGLFKDMPKDDKSCQMMSEEDEKKVMHVMLPISKETCLMGSDTIKGMSPQFKMGNNFSISINAENKNEADKLFNALSKDGQVTMPMDLTFWGAYFGMLTDKFGIRWLVNFDGK